MEPSPVGEQSFQELNAQLIHGENGVGDFWTPFTWAATRLPPQLPPALRAPDQVLLFPCQAR